MNRSNPPLEHEHTPRAIAERVNGSSRHNYLRDFVYGAIDGTVTTFAIVSGVAGAGLDPGIIVILGAANLVGDGFSMAASNYLGTKTEEQLRQKIRSMEWRHIEADPEGERAEVRQIFVNKGFEGENLEAAVNTITADRERWIDTMLTDEFGLSLKGPSAYLAAIMTFLAFCLVGVMPLLAFVYGLFIPVDTGTLYVASAVITGGAFFLVGAAKSWFVEQRWYLAGLETLVVGGIAAFLAYAVGALLKGVVGG